MTPSRRGFFAPAAFLLLTVLACGSVAPPESCGDNIGGTPDEAVFAQHFTAMELVNEATGFAGPPDSESQATFGPAETIAISYSAVGEGSLRACVQERAGGGGIPFDQTSSFVEGEGSLTLGSFPAGTYVIRAIVADALVRNLTFTVR